MNIIFASHTAIGGQFTVGSHQLAKAFASGGHTVLHVSTPVSPAHVIKYTAPDIRYRFQRTNEGLKEVSPNFYDVVPFSLYPKRLVNRGAFHRLSLNPMLSTLRPSIQSLIRKLPFRTADLVLIDEPFFYGIDRFFAGAKIIYRPTDIYPFILNDPRVAKLEHRILARADGFISTSEPVALHIEALTPKTLPSMVLENGVELEHFSQARQRPGEYERIPEPRAVYVGALDERFDWAAVLAAAQRLPELQFVLIGPNTSAPALAKNIHLLGPKPYEDIPAYLQHTQVALLPLSSHPANEGRSPMKLFEYLASGLSVVAKGTREISRRKLQGIRTYQTSSDFIEALTCSLRGSSKRDELKAAATSYSWTSRADNLLQFVERLA